MLQGDALTVLRTMEAGSVQTCVTSPPYWGLRDYGVKGQIGLERTPEAYVAKLVEVFREVRRVLKDNGTLWLNLGDSYRSAPGLRAKDLVGIPWRVAFALQADAWILRSDIIWHKPNPMPESVRDRPTKAHEYLFLLAKEPTYFYDGDAIAEALTCEPHARMGNKNAAARRVKTLTGNMAPGPHPIPTYKKRNRRTVWTITPRPYKGAHFATFPPSLVEPCVLAGSRPGDTVLDPFAGAGTTVLVAERLGRVGIGIEISREYCRLAARRMKAAAA